MIIPIYTWVAILLGMVGLASWEDFKAHQVDWWLLIFITLSTWLLAGVQGWVALKGFAIGFSLAFIITYVLFRLKIIGGADVIVMSAIIGTLQSIQSIHLGIGFNTVVVFLVSLAVISFFINLILHKDRYALIPMFFYALVALCVVYGVGQIW
jgi:Flp pilus assembly protein protease CpaA